MVRKYEPVVVDRSLDEVKAASKLFALFF